MASSNLHSSAATLDPALNWASLSLDRIEEWAGRGSLWRGMAYQRQRRVRDLVVASDGRLLATVMGGNRYVVTVWLKHDGNEPLESKCTCPVACDGCKHAVAAVIEYLEKLSRHEPVAPAKVDDLRWLELMDDFKQHNDQVSSGSADSLDVEPKEPNRDPWDSRIKEYIFGRSREDLAALVWTLAQRFPELREELRQSCGLR